MAEEWWPSKAVYDPNITKERWLELLNDEKVFNFNSMCMMRRFLDLGGEATCAELAEKYGRTDSSYNMASTQLARRILKKEKSIKQPPENLFPILYFGRSVSKTDNHKGVYIWKLRDELKAALQEIDLSKYPLEETNAEWKNLLQSYKKILRKNPKVAFDDEVYKWELITNCNKKSVSEIIEFSRYENIIDQRHTKLGLDSLLKNKPAEYEDKVTQLIQNRANLKEALSIFKEQVRKLDAGQSLPNDERTASVYLTCFNPQEYTFYKDSYYRLLCDQLGISYESSGEKYIHYMTLIDEFIPIVQSDSEIMSFYDEHTKSYVQSIKLIAQNIIYVLFESGKNLVNIAEGDTSMSKAEELAKLLKNTHNLILHGAPGTGKTYLAKNKIAPALAAELGASGAETEFVQFHPSYDYTDFVEGLRPVNDENNGQIGFERKDGVFKTFCEQALQNEIDSKKSTAEIEKEKSVDEKIEDFITNSIDTKREFRTVTGNEFYVTDSSDKNIYISIPANEKTDKLILQRNVLSILLNSDVKIDNGNDIRDFFGRKWRTQQDSYTLILYKEIKNSGTVVPLVNKVVKIELKPFVFIIDEINRGELSKIFGELFTAIDPDYRGTDGKVSTQYQNLIPAGDVFKKGFYVPENVYIIGTMNDIDRSVESMDLAMRRRFSFKEITADDSAEEMLTPGNLSNLSIDDIDEIKARMGRLNAAIISDDIGLSSSYQVGAAYFLKYTMYTDELDPFVSLWEYNLEPLLREYLRGQAGMEDKMEKLKAAYDGDGASVTSGAN